MKLFSITDVGKKREINEDYIYTYELIANTISTASAKVVTSNDAVGNLVIKIYDLAKKIIKFNY